MRVLRSYQHSLVIKNKHKNYKYVTHWLLN